MLPSARLAALLAVLAAIVMGGCGEDRREAVVRYLAEVNGIQRGAGPEFKRANDAYLRLSRGEGGGRRQARELERAERTIRLARRRLGAVRAPEAAAGLHAALLRAYDVNVRLARETAVLGRYLPAAARALRPRKRSGERLSRALARPGPAAQAAALDRYADDLEGIVGPLRRLSPPPALAAGHRAQVEELTRTSRLARRLATAIADRDTEAAARPLLAFRRARATEGGSTPARRAIAAYRLRRLEVVRASGEVARRRIELEKSFEEDR